MKDTRAWLMCATATLLSACSAPSPQSAAVPADATSLLREKLQIVDCLLPGQVRQLGGGATYLTQRRPARTTAGDCRIRGGEYVAYDRADLKTALTVWLPAAESGDPQAQTYVGEIYERGLGADPNYEIAALWYEKAAKQGHSRALFNLATLYERGLGVAEDRLQALNLYREAWGLPEDSFMYRSAVEREQESMRTALQTELGKKDAQIQILEKQLLQMQQRVASSSAQAVGAADEIQTLKQLLADLRVERQASSNRLAGVVNLRAPRSKAAQASTSMPAPRKSSSPADMDFGRFHALVIGNQNYQTVESLQTPISDAQRAAKVLADKYGFTVRILQDASDVAMLKALNDLNGILKPGDNLLIYYAGHGYRAQSASRHRKLESGYWLPVNAEAPPEDTYWVPNGQVTAHLARLPAKRILVVADSCYAGLLSADPGYLFVDENVGYSSEYIQFKLPKRSRLLLSSGGDHPVLDTDGGANSVFARAFFEELESNDGVLAAPELFARIRKRVAAVAVNNAFVQMPEFKSIKDAGHEVGDFFFVPRA